MPFVTLLTGHGIAFISEWVEKRWKHAGIVILGNEPQGRWKAISALSKPVRIRQAIERTLLPPGQWPTGDAVVSEAPYEVREAIEVPDVSQLPVAK